MKSWERSFVHTSRGKFEVFMKGEGEPICVCHLYSEFDATGDIFADTFTDSHRVILVNLRETGNSAQATEPYQLSMLETTFDLEAIRKAIGFDRWGFAGHSTGGMLGIVYAIYHSLSLSFLMVVGGAAREYMTFSPECIYHADHPHFHQMQELNEKLKTSGISIGERKSLSRLRTTYSLYDPGSYDQLFTRPTNKKMSALRMNYFSREIQLFDVTKKLPLISAPTLIICGRHDVQCPLTYSVEMKEGIPGSKLVIFERSNHYPFLEEKAAFKEEVHAFLHNLNKADD
ncbi:alpha/beta fold hydrolase [Bacillus sp. KH172YL63]|uniref:alpha/beta fold hydrolase n=1 Tax=Bacillus sp. KH172YL63 TaxID=2709784 RepID=UPI0013E41BD3|nr:alpha/beta hydrolase [Bacillus sp. KH172YL63]BCB03917.1 proline iminopeptidase [Bacillus sp. KH172YL63]